MARWLTAVWTAITAKRGCDKRQMSRWEIMLAASYINHRNRTWDWEAQKEAP